MNHIHGEVAYESNYSPFNAILGNSDEAEMLAQWFNGSHYFEQNAPIQPTFLHGGHEEINHCYSFLPSFSYESYANTEPMVDYSSMSQEQNFVSYLHVGDQGMQYMNQPMESDDAPLELLGHKNVKRKLDMNCNDEIDIVPNKKSRRPMQISKKAKNEEVKEGSNGESSSGSSEDESNGELNASDNSKKNSKEKSKSRRGTATDPQSLYAKKRREKINLRLKTLQNLVPNGTKVDISTMLEEAVEYVKFLQLQIKLLSNDEQWMYAPIAYNGMNMSLDLNIN